MSDEVGVCRVEKSIGDYIPSDPFYNPGVVAPNTPRLSHLLSAEKVG
jgi:hypothetical protein